MKSSWKSKIGSWGRWVMWLAIPSAALMFLLPATTTVRPSAQDARPAASQSQELTVAEFPTLVRGAENADARAAAPGPHPSHPAARAPDALGSTGREEVAVLPWPNDPADEVAGEDFDASLDCLIEPHQVIEIGSPVAGLIRSISVQRAQPVEAGDVLVELDSSVELAMVELAEARAEMKGELAAREALLELRRKKKKRAEQLYQSDALSLELREELETEEDVAKRELQRAREERELASLELQHARRVLDRRTIRSPISGFVVETMMSPGERVDDDPILKLAQLDPLRVEVVLPSALFGSVRTGQPAVVTPELHGGEVYVAKVAIVDPIIDAASGTFGVQLDLPNPDLAVPGGLHCQVRFLDE